MKAIRVELVRDPADGSVFYRAREGETARQAESDRVPEMHERDYHSMSALAAQAVTRLGERLEAEV